MFRPVPPRDVGLTLAGGGNRAFLQLPLLEQWWDLLGPRVAALATCSAGASMAVTFLSGRAAETRSYWAARREGVRRNFTWSRLLRGQRPTPHLPIYRDTTRYALADGGLDRIRALPFPFWILMAELPWRAPEGLAVGLAFAAYSLERGLDRGRLHPASGRALGFQPFAVDARTVRDADELTDLVLASSATPPFLPVASVRGRRVVDGGMVDNAPAFLAEAGPGITRHLILLTRPYPPHRVGFRGNRWYLAPAEPVPISRWEYTRPDLVEATRAVGHRLAATRREQLTRWLGAPFRDDP